MRFLQDRDETNEEYNDRMDAYDDSMDYDEWIELKKMRDQNKAESRITPTDGNYSLDDLPF